MPSRQPLPVPDMDSLTGKYPWLIALGPLTGLFLVWLRRQEWLRGFGTLAAAVAGVAAITAAYGLAEGWRAGEWRAMPFTVILLVGLSNLTGNTAEALMRVLAGTRAAPGGDP